MFLYKGFQSMLEVIKMEQAFLPPKLNLPITSNFKTKYRVAVLSFEPTVCFCGL